MGISPSFMRFGVLQIIWKNETIRNCDRVNSGIRLSQHIIFNNIVLKVYHTLIIIVIKFAFLKHHYKI